MNNCIWIILLLLLCNCNNGGNQPDCGCGNARGGRRDGGNARDDRRAEFDRDQRNDSRDGCGCGSPRNDDCGRNNNQPRRDDRAVGPMPIFGPESSCGCNASEIQGNGQMPVNGQM